MQWAHKAIDARLPEQSQQTTLRSLEDAELRKVVEGFVTVWEKADVDAFISLFAHDDLVAMSPGPTWFAGRDAIGAFLGSIPLAAQAPRHRVRADLVKRPTGVWPL